MGDGAEGGGVLADVLQANEVKRGERMKRRIAQHAGKEERVMVTCLPAQGSV